MPTELLDENKPLPVAGRTPYQIGYDRIDLNQPPQRYETHKALHHAIENGQQVTLDVVKSRLLRGENNEFSVAVAMELAEQLMAYKQADQQRLAVSPDNASDEPIYAPI